ncbi:MAG: hypothetical protein JWO55_195 [Candidatus Saccharibacteria bacterium]|jgi:hypothetical protein|nr:hypothetical protein [Candidatus Saccharibacteria bacterium]
MARYIYIDDASAFDTMTGGRCAVIELTVRYLHLRNNLLEALYYTESIKFTPNEPLLDLPDTGIDDKAQSRRLVVGSRQLESGGSYMVIVAVQASLGSKEYIDCVIDEPI